MVVLLREEPAAFDPEDFPEWVWLSNLFGRATRTWCWPSELTQAYDVVERELKIVADIQRSLLPKTHAEDPRPGLAAHYRPRSGPAATTTTSSRCPTAAGAS